ncbi:MAG: hypothetical protein PHI02_04445 [Sulfurovaceae bacterium]|nr:hypothetical protein [Sulfurovaceae bacterium]
MFKQYRRTQKAELRPVTEEEIRDGIHFGISISDVDRCNGSPKLGDMIARNPENHNDMWLVAKEYFDKNFEELSFDKSADDVSTPRQIEKTLGNTCANGATKNVKDIVFWGDGDLFKLISKASSENEGWMKSTKAMQCGDDVVVQVTTQQRNPDGSYVVAEALTTVQNACIEEKEDAKGVITSRYINTKYFTQINVNQFKG